MNHLAHLLLADSSDEGVLGNFLGDFVKGRPEYRYPPTVVRGIRLHRRIDCFTDRHAAVRRAVKRLPPAHRRIAGITVDMAFDHFLARDWATLNTSSFSVWRRHVYSQLDAHRGLMPLRARHVLPAMIEEDWLAAYADWDGVVTALHAMSRRLSRPAALLAAIADLTEARQGLEQDFRAFWPAVRCYASAEDARLARDQS